jgi:acyl-CoA reductase-like NAD-dependent aldehyde dehydrogenase
MPFMIIYFRSGVGHKLGPVIADGCPVVPKPASQTPFCAIKLAGLLIDARLPTDYLHLVAGGGGTVGTALVDHLDVAAIRFAGSPEVGWGIHARAPRKRAGLELGNNAPVITEPGGDSRAAAAKIKMTGRHCLTNSGDCARGAIVPCDARVFVDDSIVDEFMDELVAYVKTLVVGDPMDEATDGSALISVAECDRVQERVDEATRSGGRIAVGGDIDGAGVRQPTLIVDAMRDMRVCAFEVFGPVVAGRPTSLGIRAREGSGRRKHQRRRQLWRVASATSPAHLVS